MRLGLLVMTCLLTSCAAERFHKDGLSKIAEGKFEDGVASLGKAVAEAPDNAQYRKALLTEKANVIERLLIEAAALRSRGDMSQAEEVYTRVLGLNAGNARALAGLDSISRDRRHKDEIARARAALKQGDIDQASRLLRSVQLEKPEHSGAAELAREIEELQTRRQTTEPMLRSNYSKPVNLEVRDANVKMIFESLARSTGINFILDKDVRPDLRTTVYLRNAPIEEAIDLIVQTSQLQRKVLNKNTVLVYPNTVEKLKDYQELVLKSFYLQNADTKQVQSSLQTLLKTKDIVVDEKLNLIVIRDTPEAIRLAEKLVAMHDLPEPEVMLDVEVIEVQRSKLQALGVQWPNQISLTPLASGGGSSLRVEDLQRLNAKTVGVSMGATTINIRKDLSDVNILANPRIRARNREKAKILIGDKLPVVTTTTTATGIVSDNIQYLDVGIKLDVAPDIRLRDDVAIKVDLEVSSITKEVRTGNGSLSYQVGTRNASTVLRLRDGETQILAGLINDQERSSAARIPLLGDIPLLGRLFGSQQDDTSKTEIVLSITPHLVRNLTLPEAKNGEFWSGTESYLRTRPLSLSESSERDRVATLQSSPDGALGALRAEPQAPATSIDLSWDGPRQARSGDVIKLALRLKSDGMLQGLPFQLGFDAKSFQVVEVDEGEYFRANGGTASFTKNIDAALGKIFVSVASTATGGAQGEGELIKLSLRGLPDATAGEIQVLLASPLGHGDKPISVVLPPPHTIKIEQ